jgi:hypothetical protein
MSTVSVMRASTSTRTRTAVHLTDAITGGFAFIISHLDLSTAYLSGNWDAIELGLMTWIKEGSLAEVYLEFGDANNPLAVFEVPIEYYFTGDAKEEYVANRVRLARLAAKIREVPRGTAYRVVVSHNGEHTDVSGWSPTNLADRSGLATQNLGTLGSGPDAAASLLYHARRA